MQKGNLRGRLILAVLMIGAGSELAASPPPPAKKQPVADPRPVIHVPLKQRQQVDWGLHQNLVDAGIRVKSKDGQQDLEVVQAVNISKLDQAQRREPFVVSTEEPEQESPFAVWTMQVDDRSARLANGYVSAVDENVFTDLRMVDARRADKLGLDGIVIGRVKLKEV